MTHPERATVRVAVNTETAPPQVFNAIVTRLRSEFRSLDRLVVNFVARADGGVSIYFESLEPPADSSLGSNLGSIDGVSLQPIAYQPVELFRTFADELVAGQRVHGRYRAPRHEQLTLSRVEQTPDRPKGPVTAKEGKTSQVLEMLGKARQPAIVQVVLHPVHDWRSRVPTPYRRRTADRSLEDRSGELVGLCLERGLINRQRLNKRVETLEGERAYVDETAGRWRVNIRILVGRVATARNGKPPRAHADTLANTIASKGGNSPYELTATEADPATVYQDIQTRRLRIGTPVWRLIAQAILPGRHRVRPSLLLTPPEAAGVVSPADTDLPAHLQDYMDTVGAADEFRYAPSGRTLQPLTGPGMELGQTVPASDTASDPQPLRLGATERGYHLAIFGKTGTGKTTAIAHSIDTRAAQEPGPTFGFDPDGNLTDRLLRRQYRRTDGTGFGSIEVIAVREAAPHLPLFDLRPLLSLDLNRAAAIDNTIKNAHRALANAAQGQDDDLPPRSIERLDTKMRELFDRGRDCFSASELLDELKREYDGEPTADATTAEIKAFIEALEADDAHNNILLGAVRHLKPLFDQPSLQQGVHHPPESVDEIYDLQRRLTGEGIIIFDFDGVSDESTRLLSQFLLSQLYQYTQETTTPNGWRVDLVIDEADNAIHRELLQTLLDRGRKHDLGVCLLTQTPQQLVPDREANGSTALLENLGTILSPTENELTAKFMAADSPGIDAATAKSVLASLEDDEYLFAPRVSDGETRGVPPFVIERPTPGDGILATDAEMPPEYEAAKRRYHDHIQARSGIRRLSDATPEPTSASLSETQINTTLETASLPDGVVFDGEELTCEACGTRYPRRQRGVIEAYNCCRTDPPAIDCPIIDVLLQVDEQSIKAAPLPLEQLKFLRLLERAHKRIINRRAFDLRTDSMTIFRDELGLSEDTIETLAADGYVRIEDSRTKLYSLTYKGFETLAALRGESTGETLQGPETPHYTETIIHVKCVDIAIAYLQTEYIDDPSSPVVDYDLEYAGPDGWLDVVGLSDDGTVVVAIEADLGHNPHQHAPDDYDAMAAVNPEEAIWIVPKTEVGHDIIKGLSDPTDGSPRIDTNPEAVSAPLTRYDLEAAGCSKIMTMTQALPDD